MAKENDRHQHSHRDGSNNAENYRRIELITGKVRRRLWSVDQKRQIVAESFEHGANIRAVARRHGVSSSLLHCWRKKARAAACQQAQLDIPAFVPVSVKDTAPRSTERVIEVEIGGALVRVPGGIDVETLTLVLCALRRAS